MALGSEPFEPRFRACAAWLRAIRAGSRLNISIYREDYGGLLFHNVEHSNTFSISNLCTLQLGHFTITLQTGFLPIIYTAKPRAWF
jgi:hypothetical protein